jgi:hypothetical protein
MLENTPPPPRPPLGEYNGRCHLGENAKRGNDKKRKILKEEERKGKRKLKK